MKEKKNDLWRYILHFAEWIALALLLGGLGGLLGAAFHHTLHGVTDLREGNTWLIFLLPLGGLLSVSIYWLFRLQANRGTNEVIDAVLDGAPVKAAVAPTIFLSTTITHLLGGSAGREGAALQLGGSTACLISRFFRLTGKERRILILSGMSAVFAGLFGTPLTATLFCMEFASVGTWFSPALLPCYLAALIASRVSGALGVHAETAVLEAVTALNWANAWKFVVLAILLALLGIFMCRVFHEAEHWMKRFLKNPWLRIAVGGVLILGITLLVGDHRYNGAGMHMALTAVAGEAAWQDFLLKMLLTAITLAAGFKGGEIVPTFCIGATFGCVAGSLLGLEPGMAAALGLVGLFCCATKSPFASIVLSVEMFGGENLHIFALVCVICFVLSGKGGLYSSQIIQFDMASVLAQEDACERVSQE